MARVSDGIFKSKIKSHGNYSRRKRYERFLCFKINSMQEAVRPVFFVNTILGMGIIEYPYGHSRPLISSLYSGTLLCLQIFIAIYAAEYMKSTYLWKSHDLGNFLFQAIFYVNNVTASFTIATGWLKIKRMRDVILYANKCDNMLERLGAPKNYLRIFIGQLLLFALNYALLTPALTSDMIGLIKDNPSIYTILILYVSNTHPLILTFTVDISFMCWLRYWKFKFEQLNNILRGLLTTIPDSPQHKRTLSVKNLQYFTIDSSNTRMDTIKMAIQVYFELTKGAKRLNETFSVQILISLTSAFSFITATLYYAYTVKWHEISREDLGLQIFIILSWTFFYVIKIVAISHLCAAVTKEASYTGDIVCELHEPSASKEFRSEIRDFTLQLIQNPLTFTACGFFVLDYTFIHKAIGSITTYLVILIQVGGGPDYETTPDYYNLFNTTEYLSSNGTY